MNAWLIYYGKLMISLLPIFLLLIPAFIWQAKRFKTTIANQAEALRLQRRSIELQEEQIGIQKALMELLKK